MVPETGITWLVTLHEKGAVPLPLVMHGVDTQPPNDPVSSLRTLTCTLTIAPAGEMPAPVKVLTQSFGPGVRETEPASTGGVDGLGDGVADGDGVGGADGDGVTLGGLVGVALGSPVGAALGSTVGVGVGDGLGVAVGSTIGSIGDGGNPAGSATVIVTDDRSSSDVPSSGCNT